MEEPPGASAHLMNMHEVPLEALQGLKRLSSSRDLISFDIMGLVGIGEYLHMLRPPPWGHTPGARGCFNKHDGPSDLATDHSAMDR